LGSPPAAFASAFAFLAVILTLSEAEGENLLLARANERRF
jgi:hypothetical protein